MSNVESQGSALLPPRRDDIPGQELVASGSIFEAIAGVTSVLLAVLGLAGVLPSILAPVAAVFLSAAMFVEGSVIAARVYRLYRGSGGSADMDLSGGLGAEVLAGLLGLTLGTLALAGVNPPVLLSVTALGLGTGVLFGSATTPRLGSIVVSGNVSGVEDPATPKLAPFSLGTAAGVQVLIGITTIVLAVLALLGMAPVVSSLVVFLLVGLTMVLEGAALAARLMKKLLRP
jgi:hypothetical protein